jgi:hypothetical protein
VEDKAIAETARQVAAIRGHGLLGKSTVKKRGFFGVFMFFSSLGFVVFGVRGVGNHQFHIDNVRRD